MLTWQCTWPAAHVGTPNDDDGVLAVGLEHHNGVTCGRGRHHGQVVEANPTAAKRVGEEAAIGVVADRSDEVGRVGELGGARGLVGALAAGEGLAGLRREGLALARETVDLHVDVGVGGAHHHHRRRLRRIRRETEDSEIVSVIAEREELDWGNGVEETGWGVGVETVVWCC